MALTKNDIKKLLYKVKPIAKLKYLDMNGIYYYEAIIDHESFKFKIPYRDMGETIFDNEIPAQFLIRWLDE